MNLKGNDTLAFGELIHSWILTYFVIERKETFAKYFCK